MASLAGRGGGAMYGRVHPHARQAESPRAPAPAKSAARPLRHKRVSRHFTYEIGPKCNDYTKPISYVTGATSREA
eukprot:CAMPEP_0198242042 /NCGR_PEP_ID=MMETSP1446-20131203/9378_1 /TAXON_ID=1461542 ORGANISM="Unidentified sp, Strain CCMP2111" /NCGR_SAMPLE_ID=MMETSP1446 /ASSEMBLY_ACC=CAM_ASM_001112 /LENGTH=74 /DNA_ID=CAMNT_0043925183 /DNA_START=75 /DNA_END=299 /DNA_ORIENTATION=-